ncbi:hypothetical protein [Hyphomicrobium sp.]|uniref:hypothetical protein n=1 Tax=Hyphomicrobium sp. TaxID=82 RepID=UPI0025C3D507|nr:hypothetical protein [Hyphomicrobium sp.]
MSATKKRNWTAAAAAALMVAFVAPMAQADSISGVEGARAKERQGRYLNRQDREQLRRYGGNDDSWRGYRGYDYSYGYDGPGVSVYVGPRGYYGPYDY